MVCGNIFSSKIIISLRIAKTQTTFNIYAQNLTLNSQSIYSSIQHPQKEKEKQIDRGIMYLELAKSQSFPVLEKIITPTSASHKIASSFAFFSKPFLRFENVTCLLVELSILLITIFPLPIPNPNNQILRFRKALAAKRSTTDTSIRRIRTGKNKKAKIKTTRLRKRKQTLGSTCCGEEGRANDFPRKTERILKRKKKKEKRKKKNYAEERKECDY